MKNHELIKRRAEYFREVLEDAAQKRKTLLDITRETGLAGQTIMRYQKVLGIKKRPNKIEATPENEEKFTKLYKSGVILADIANEFGVSLVVARTFVDHLGLHRPRPNGGNGEHTPEGRNEAMLNMRQRGFTLEEIGAAFGVTRERVRQILKRHFPSEYAASSGMIRTVKVKLREKICRGCGLPYNKEDSDARNFCSAKCRGLYRDDKLWTRDTALKIMKLREEGATWEDIGIAIGFNGNSAHFRTQIQRRKPALFSSEEQHRFFPPWDEFIKDIGKWRRDKIRKD